MRTRKVLQECRVVIDLGTRRYPFDTDASFERRMHEDAADLVSFIRDHRSRDAYSIDIETEYMECCVFCWREYEEDHNTGEPLCCRRAVEHWEAEQYCVLAQQAEGGAT